MYLNSVTMTVFKHQG